MVKYSILLYRNSHKDTIGDFDDMSDAFPRRGQIPFVPQADFISLHQSHIYRVRWKKKGNAIKYYTLLLGVKANDVIKYKNTP